MNKTQSDLIDEIQQRKRLISEAEAVFNLKRKVYLHARAEKKKAKRALENHQTVLVFLIEELDKQKTQAEAEHDKRKIKCICGNYFVGYTLKEDTCPKCLKKIMEAD